jgi:type I restriction enzyme S subunit
MNHKTIIPELRFQEFDGEWETNKLSDWKLKVIDGDRGKNYPNGDDFSPEGYCLFMNAKNVTKNGFSFDTLNSSY